MYLHVFIALGKNLIILLISPNVPTSKCPEFTVYSSVGTSFIVGA